jgi:hypothetical protein
VLFGQGYHTPRGAVTDDYGAVVECSHVFVKT